MEPVAEWDVARVVRWFNQNGFPGYDDTLKEHSIDGEVLVNLDHESLKDLGIRALGRRLLVLKSIYFLKLQHDIPITSDSYVPQTVDVEPDYIHGSSYQRKQKRQTEENISRMMEELSTLSSEINTIRGDMQRIYRLSILENKPLPAPSRQGNDPFSGTVVVTRRHQTSTGEYEPRRDVKSKGQSSSNGGLLSAAGAATQTPVSTSSGSVPVSANSAFANTPTGNPTSGGSGVNGSNAGGTGGGSSSLLLSSGHVVSSPSSQTPVTPHIRVYGDNALQRENESYKSFRISADDPCSTILPHALKKYHIFDAWHNYSLCIQYGSSSKGKSERILALDEKPLHLFQQLKDAGESPVFVLKKKNAGQGQSQGQSEAGASPYRLSVRGNSANGGGSRTSLFSLENNNTSTSSLEIPSSKSGTTGATMVGSIAAAGSSTNEFEKI